VLARSLPEPVRSSRPAFETAKWARSALPFLITGSMQIVNREISVTLLGLLQGAEQAGLYRVAQRGADLVPFGLMAVNMAIGPTVAQLFAQGRLEALQRLVSRSALAVLLFGLPVALVLIAGGQWLLPRLFGLGFEKAYPVLVLLSLGQLINTAFGSVGLVLNMSGLERFTALGVSIASVVNVLANLALIPGYGTVGAAIATSCSLLLWNSLLAFWLYRQTGLFCGAGLKRLIWSG
jgi:O-antigen/teichoic acid export membrane protein